jgi:predicted RNase H-like HicB family nuclease
MESKPTAVYRKIPEGYIAFVEELPSANTQGSSIEEARENLREAHDQHSPRHREINERREAAGNRQ